MVNLIVGSLTEQVGTHFNGPISNKLNKTHTNEFKSAAFDIS